MKLSKQTIRRARKAVAAAMASAGVAVAQGLIVGRGAALVAVLGTLLIALGVYKAPANSAD